MPRLGYMLFSELNGPNEMLEQAVAAEEAGFDLLTASDHYHPWQSEHTDSPFVWSVLGAVAARTERVGIATTVTCPFLRYHPAIIAQAAATVAMLSDGRFTLGLGTGERLSEHVVGAGWPSVDVRHAMLVEAIEVIRLLWSGEFTTYRGEHVTVEDAKVFSLPERPPAIAVAAGGDQALGVAIDHGDALVIDQPASELVDRFKDERGEDARVIGVCPVSWDEDAATAEEMARRFAFGMPGWKVMAELPNPINFDATIALIRQEDVLEQVGAGATPDPILEAAGQYVDAGVDELSFIQVGDDRLGFIDFAARELLPELR
jgi:G6PDH family F420-dependent oxidoreductase